MNANFEKKKAVRSVAAVKPLHSSLPKGYTVVCSGEDGDEYNFLGPGLESLHLAVKLA